MMAVDAERDDPEHKILLTLALIKNYCATMILPTPKFDK